MRRSSVVAWFVVMVGAPGMGGAEPARTPTKAAPAKGAPKKPPAPAKAGKQPPGAEAKGEACAAAAEDEDDGPALYKSPRPMFQWEFPKVLSEVEVPEEFETNGIPNRFRALVVDMAPADTYGFYLASFARQGLYVAPVKEQLEMEPGQAALTGYDPDREISYTVFMTAYDNGTTGVIVGEAYFKGREVTPGDVFVPVMKGGEDTVTQKLESGRSLTFRVKSTEAEVRTFYGQVFRDRGYKQEKDGSWTRGRSVMSILAEPSLRHPGSLDVGVVEFMGPAH